MGERDDRGEGGVRERSGERKAGRQEVTVWPGPYRTRRSVYRRKQECEFCAKANARAKAGKRETIGGVEQKQLVSEGAAPGEAESQLSSPTQGLPRGEPDGEVPKLWTQSAAWP